MSGFLRRLAGEPVAVDKLVVATVALAVGLGWWRLSAEQVALVAGWYTAFSGLVLRALVTPTSKLPGIEAAARAGEHARISTFLAGAKAGRRPLPLRSPRAKRGCEGSGTGQCPMEAECPTGGCLVVTGKLTVATPEHEGRI